MPRWRTIGVDTLPALKAESFRLSLVIHMDRQVERFWQTTPAVCSSYLVAVFIAVTM
jgi:hypothetical protein